MSTQGSGAAKRISTRGLLEMKRRGDRIAVLTAYDWLFAQLVDLGGVEVVLVGDSLAHVFHGYDSTLPLTLDEIIYHARAAVRGVQRALVVVDMPFLTYQVTPEEALRNAGRILRESGAGAVKVEGGGERMAATVSRLVEAGIPVMGHLGFTPQSANVIGRNRVQGREDEDRTRMIEDAQRLEEAGVFSIVLELIPGALAEEITAAVQVPTIGIGAGPGCDGQVLVLQDMLGLNREFNPKFLRRFANLGDQAEEAIREYVRSVKAGEYPTAEHTFA